MGSAAHATVPNAYECVVQNEIRFEAGKQYGIVVNCANQSVNVSFTVSRCPCKFTEGCESDICMASFNCQANVLKQSEAIPIII